MSIFTGKGKDIKERVAQDKKEKDSEKLDYKKLKINKDLKKAGDSTKVRILGKEDFTTYEAHVLYDKGLYTTPCINPTGDGEDRCLMCEASKLKGFEGLGAKTRFLFAFYDLELAMVRYIDVSYGQGIQLMDDIEEYEDELAEYGFTLKRQGEGTKTAYKLSPILKLKGADKEAFENPTESEVAEGFFEKALYIKSTNQQAIELENAGIDVEAKFGYVIQDDDNEKTEGEGNNNKTVDEGDGDKKDNDGDETDPEKVF